VASRILRTGAPAREDAWNEVDGPIAAPIRDRLGVRSSVGSPIVVEGKVWGALFVHVTRQARLPPETEARLSQFTRLVATAIANAQARVELQRLAEEQGALLRVAELVARGAPPAEVFETVAEELGKLTHVEGAKMLRYEPGETAAFVGSWGPLEAGIPAGARLSHRGTSVTGRVFATGLPARVEDYGCANGEIAEIQRRAGMRSAVGAPIRVAGRLWGALIVGSVQSEPLPPDTEGRMSKFADLVAAAIANTEARSELTESRARIVRTSDEVRRRFERDLHDGVQQRLVSVALDLRGVGATLPLALEQPRAELDRIALTLSDAFEELRELSRGLHPAILRQGGLGPAIGALARRCAVPVDVQVELEGRLPEPVEVAAYFVVSEALANSVKHARASAAAVTVELVGSTLRLVAGDDGIGGADPARGSGLVGLIDRVEALGGTIEIGSVPGQGTTIRVELPAGA
jgi:signal transduction histidine kinase